MKIKLAKIQDTPQMLGILQENLVDISDPKVLQNQHQNGFLIRHIGVLEMEELVLDDKNNTVLAAKENDKMLGYLIACRLNNMRADLCVGLLPSLRLQEINQLEKVIYHRQIAVKNGFKGVGRLLLEEFLSLAKKSGYQYVVCRIIHQPIYNQKSVLFHQKFGFKQIGDDVNNAVVAGVYLCDLNLSI
jgi:hypothetical protein